MIRSVSETCTEYTLLFMHRKNLKQPIHSVNRPIFFKKYA